MAVLTAAQLASLKADIAADGTLNAIPMTAAGDALIAEVYNANVSPVFWVWRTRVTKNEYMQSTSQDGTTFNWVGNGFITRAVGEQTAWREIFGADGVANPSLVSVRQAVADIFSGTGTAAANRAHLLAVSRRVATRLEKLFATGAGTIAVPAVMSLTAEGPLSAQDVLTARNLP